MTTSFDPAETAAQNTARTAVRSDAREQRWDAEVAPLLAARGVDIDALKGKGLDALNEALALAAERHKLAALTPRGEQRTGALVILRAFVEALDGNDAQRAQEVLAGVPIEPDGALPAVSHVIGTAASLLDVWFVDATLQPALVVTPVSKTGDKLARAVATDLVGLARRGRAFASLDGLRKRYSGLLILEGAALGVAAATNAVATREERAIQVVLSQLLADDEAMAATASGIRNVPSQSVPTGSSFARPGTLPMPRSASRDLAPAALQDRFGAWLAQQTKIAAPNVEAELEMFRSMVELGDARGLDVERPGDIEPLIDLLRVMGSEERPEVAHNALATLDDYLHFRLLGTGGEAWEAAHRAVEAALRTATTEADTPDASALGAVLAAADKTDPVARIAALMQLRLVAGVNELLDWIGRSKEVSEDGSLTEDDLVRLGELLGSAGAREWWAALVYTGIIEVGASRARRGPQASDWAASDMPPLALAEKLVDIFVAENLTAPLRNASDAASKALVAGGVAKVLGLLTDQEQTLGDQAVPATLHALVAVTLLEPSGRVPEMLRGAVARGTLHAMEILTGEGPKAP